MIEVRCPECGQRYRIEDQHLGRSAKCSGCAKVFVLQVAPGGSVPPSMSANAGGVRLSPRQRRLMSDERKLMECFQDFPYIHVVEKRGTPPDRYVIEYRVRGIERLEGERPVYRDSHRMEIELPGTYPRTPPQCRMLTPIFHPNIEPSVVCIGDHWTAAERLSDLVIRVGEMICYQSYNIQSPLDGEAAMWADLHQDMLPTDKSDLMPADYC